MIIIDKKIHEEIGEKSIKLIKDIIKKECKKINKKIKIISIKNLSFSEIINLNKKVFKKDYLTDVISINYETEILDAEIYICLKMIMENAKKYKIDYKEEIYRVIFHGFLHLVGYDDKEKKMKEKMFKKQNSLIANVSRETKNQIYE